MLSDAPVLKPSIPLAPAALCSRLLTFIDKLGRHILFCRSALAEFVGELTKSDGDMPFLPTPVRVAASSYNDDSTFDRLTSRQIPS